MQHGRHLAGADPFGAGQAGAVFHHQVRRGDAFLGQPLAHDTLRSLGIVAIGIVAKLCPQAQEQLLGHGVVTVFIDVADDLRQVRRESTSQDFGILGHRCLDITALDGAAQFLPDRPHGACGVGGVVEQRQVGLRAAAITQLAADGHGHAAVGGGHRAVAHVAGALFGVGDFHLVVDANAGNRRLDRHDHPP